MKMQFIFSDHSEYFIKTNNWNHIAELLSKIGQDLQNKKLNTSELFVRNPIINFKYNINSLNKEKGSCKKM